MNDLNSILSFIPEKYRAAVVAIVTLSPLITRAIYSLSQGGGIKGIFTAIWLGTNQPKPTPPTDTATKP